MPQKQHMLNASPRAKWGIESPNFNLWPFKMLDYKHSGVLAPRALYRSLGGLGFDRGTLLGFISSGIHYNLPQKLNNMFL